MGRGERARVLHTPWRRRRAGTMGTGGAVCMMRGGQTPCSQHTASSITNLNSSTVPRACLPLHCTLSISTRTTAPASTLGAAAGLSPTAVCLSRTSTGARRRMAVRVMNTMLGLQVGGRAVARLSWSKGSVC